MDENKDGVITKEELKTLLRGVGDIVDEGVIDEMVNLADENGDGKIQFMEFVNKNKGNLPQPSMPEPS